MLRLNLMSRDLPKAYEPAEIEERWAQFWAAEKLFDVPTPSAAQAAATTFTQLLPPPNVTGRLHMGHMLNQTEMDILARWHRMRGETSLWVPGTDHAGIATQLMVERQLIGEGSSREQIGREQFTERVWQWKTTYGNAILDQMKRLGASVDWSREYFTMDDRLSIAVKEAFVRLYEQGLIYRGERIVNWDPAQQTAVSDLEVNHEDRLGKLYSIRYRLLDGPLADGTDSIVIATTRPETLLGDVAVVVNPDDERYTKLVGKLVTLPFTNRQIPILADDWARPEFGTGAVKVTPAHDPNDFAIGERHALPSLTIMDETAHIDLPGSPYHGLDRFAAREQIVKDLDALGLLVEIKDHTLAIATSQRSGVIIEPRLSKQWFLKIQPLADKAIQAVDEGHIRFTPENYKRTYDEWMRNIHDWCISRQLWWGHRIPAWFCDACGAITISRDTPSACTGCGSSDIRQETDVLDTWFSSGLLPVSVFGWPGPIETQTYETIRETAYGEATYDRQIGKTGNFAYVKLRIAPNDAGKGYEFSSEVASSTLPEIYSKAVESGVQEAMGRGILNGLPMADIKVALVGGSYRAVDSNEMSFKIAGAVSFQEAARRAKPVLLEREGLACTPNLAAFYPTSLLTTGSDILFFWVARMIMFGTHFMLDIPMPDGSPRTLANAVPFREVYIHALVRDADRQKMSKTKGNVIDPIEIVTRFGTDAVRFTLASMASPGTDIAFSEARTEGNRAFANKIWNAARFLFLQLDRAEAAGYTVALGSDPTAFATLPDATPLESRWILSRLSAVCAEVDRALTAYRFDEAAGAVYQFFWGELCDWYLELVKLRLDFGDPSAESSTHVRNEVTAISLATLSGVFETSLRLLSPFMPFLTEEIWHALYNGQPPAKSIALTRYPQAADLPADSTAEAAIATLQELIVTIRGIRKELGVPEKEAAAIQVHGDNHVLALADANADMLARMARVSAVEFADAPLSGANARSTASFDAAVLYERPASSPADVAAERSRLAKELGRLEKGLIAADRQLGNEGFMAKAPAPIVAGLRKQADETRALYEKTRKALDDLPPA